MNSIYGRTIRALLMLSLAVGTAWAQGHGVEVRSLAPVVADTAPGRILSVTFRVSSQTAQTRELAETLQLPAGWTALVPGTTFELAAGGSVSRLLAVAVPREAAPGTYPISYAVRDPRDAGVNDQTTMTVSVAAVSGLELVIQDSPAQAVAGDTFEVAARVLNRGNAAVTVRLSGVVPPPHQVTVTPAQVTLAPGASAVVKAAVHTDRKQTRSVTLTARLSATADNNATAPAEARAAVEVLTVTGAQPDPYRRLPMEATVRLSGSGSPAALQAQLTGQGYLDEAQTQSVDFSFTTPDTTSTSFLGQREEYWLNVHAPRLDLRLGDQSYGLSYLTDYARYGRGIAVEVRPSGPWSLQACTMKSRWDAPQRSAGGVAVRRDWGPTQHVQINWMSQDDETTGPAQLLSVGGETDLLGGKHHLAGEVAQSRTGGGVTDQAYQVQLGGVLWPGSYYSITKQHAGPQYQGYFRDADYTQAGLTSPLGRNLAAHLSYSNWRTGLAPTAGADNASRERLVQAGVSYQFSPEWSLEAEWGWMRRQEGALPVTTDTDEALQRYGVGYHRGRLATRVELLQSRETDRLHGTVTNPRTVNVYASYLPSDKLSLTAFGTLGDDGQSQPNSYLLGNSNTLGVGVNWHPSERLTANVAYTRYAYAAGAPDQDQLTAQVAYRLANGCQVKAEVRQDKAFVGDLGQREFLLSYTVPFGLALGRKRDSGVIQGRVFEAEGAGQPGLAKVVVVCSGAGAVATHADGSFSFAGLPAGQYTLQVQRSSVGIDRVPEAKMPLAVQVLAGQTVPVSIGVAPAGQLAGRVQIHRGVGGTKAGEGGALVTEGAAQTGAVTADAPMADLLLELSRDGEVLRTATDARGEFRFDSLRPGRYHLHVCDGQVPELYALDQPDQDIEISGRAPAQVEFAILPVTRHFNVVDAGTMKMVETR